MSLPKIILALLGAGLACSGPAAAADPIVIGVLTDMSGVYADFNGRGLVRAVEIAVREHGGTVLGRPVRVESVDPQGKADNALTAARQWIDRDHAPVLLESVNSVAAIALQKLTEEKKTLFFSFSGTSALTNEACSPYGIQYVWNNYAMSGGAGKSENRPGEKWFFVTADYTFGKTLEEETRKVVEARGAKVVGVVRHPLGTADFSSYLLQAQAAGAQVLALANAGRDTQNAVLQATEFGLPAAGIRVQPLLMFDTDIRGIGLRNAQGTHFVTSFYWDQNDRARSFSKTFFEAHQAMPSMNQAGAYSATLQYLKAVEAAGTLEPDAVRMQLGKMRIDDAFVSGGTIQPNGNMLHDLSLMEVKSPTESTGPWDIAKLVRRIPGADVYQPLAESTCRFLAH